MKVKVVKLDLTVPYENYKKYEDMLPSERAEKLRRFRFEPDQIRSLAAGVLLQKEMEARGVADTCVIKAGKHGKLYLEGEGAFHFSISHAGDYAALAVSDTPVGVDIEKVDLREKVAGRFYSKREQEEIRITPDPAKAEMFTKIWTGKEAYLKYTGKGLIDPLESIEVLDPLFWRQKKVYFSGMPVEGGAYYLTICTPEPVSVSDVTEISDFYI